LQFLRNARRELLQLADYQPQFRFLRSLLEALTALILHLGQALARCRDPRLEFRPLEQTIAVGIDQPRDHPLQIRDRLVDVFQLTVRVAGRCLEPPFVLGQDALGLGQ
jgi:hypothetical protein